MDYTSSLLWLAAWPVLIYGTYQLITFAVKKLDA